MSEFSDLQRRVKLDNLIGYLMYGSESIMEHNGTYEDRISQSYDKIFETLGKLFPSASRKNEDLFGAVVDFSLTHNEVYLEMGFLAGFQLFTELREKCQDSELMGLQLMIKKHCNERMEMEKEK